MQQAVKQIQEAERIIIVCGAGISVACGIPDFRSPKTGLYNQLASYNLPEPTAMFSIDYFILRPHPFYTLTQHIFPDSVFKPSYTHCFFKLLQDKGKLHYVITQNIDTIENTVGINKELLSQAHGSYLSGIYCVGCSYTTENHLMLKSVSLDGAVPHCPNCGRLLKPAIVFFGENLPEECMYYSDKIYESDLMMVLGTSLNVGPVNKLPLIALGNLKDRILINNVVVGDFVQIQKDREENDTVLIGQCDEVIKNLAKELKWDKDLEAIYKTYQEYKLPEQPKPSSDLTLIGLEDSLIIPDAKIVDLNGKVVMLALASQNQIGYLRQNVTEREQSISNTHVDKLFSIQNIPSKIPVFGRIVKIQGKVVYSPLQGHFASYITKYVRCTKVDTETNVWDLITRYNGTNTQEKSNKVRQVDASLFGSHLNLCYVNYQCLQHFISGDSESVEVEQTPNVEYALYTIKFQLGNSGVDEKIEAPTMQIKLQFDADDKSEILQKLSEKKSFLMDQIKDVTRQNPTDITLNEKVLTISFGKQAPNGGPEILKSVIESFWAKWSVKVSKK